jgi:outer membrane protein assembly factor BamB
MNPSVFAVVLALSAPPEPGEWPQWRGPHRTGEAVGARLPAKWGTNPPPPRWSSFVGEGYSSPVVKSGRVFILGRDKEDRETCLCFDADSGKPVWSHAYPAGKPQTLQAGAGPKSTPTVDRDRVYMLGIGGMFHCLDVETGRVLWKHDFAAAFWGQKKDPNGYDAWFPPAGSAASAVVEGERVIVPVGGPNGGAITAFDRRTGAVVWKGLTDRSSYGSPVVADLAGTRQLVGFTGLRMVGLDVADGKLLWEHPFPAFVEQTMLTPVVWKDLVIVGGENKSTVALRIEKREGTFRPKVVWRAEDLKAYLTTPVVVKDHLVGLDNRLHRLVCVSLATGEMTWESKRIGEYASLVVAGDKILALNEVGELYVLSADPKNFVQVAKWKLGKGAGTWSHLALVGSRLFVKDADHLHCYDLADVTGR